MDTTSSSDNQLDTQTDTQKVYASMANSDTELQEARNDLAIAMRNYAVDQTRANKSIMIQAQDKVHRLEHEYREARLFVLQHISNKQTTKGKTS